MGKKIAILVKGINQRESPEDFERECTKNFRIINEIARQEGYNIKLTSLERIIHDKNNCYCNKDADVLFYYTGHANSQYIGTFDFQIKDVLGFLKSFKGKKFVIIDGCAAEKGFESHDFPNNSLVISKEEVYPSQSIAKLLYDAVIAYNIPLNDLTKKTFEDMKQPDIFFAKNY